MLQIILLVSFRYVYQAECMKQEPRYSCPWLLCGRELQHLKAKKVQYMSKVWMCAHMHVHVCELLVCITTGLHDTHACIHV